MSLPRRSVPRTPAFATAVFLAAVIRPGLLAAQAPARAQTPAKASATQPTHRSAPTPVRPTADVEPPACDTTPAPPRWADQFRRHAVASTAPAATRATPRSSTSARPGRTPRPAAHAVAYVAPHLAHAVAAPTAAAASGRVSGHAPVRPSTHGPAHAPAPTHGAAHPSAPRAATQRSGVRVRKAQTACPTRMAGVAAGDLSPPAYGDALEEAFGSPLANEVSEAPAIGPRVGIESGGEVDAGAATPTAGGTGARGFSLPRLGWGTLVVGGIGIGIAVVPGGGSDGGVGSGPGIIDWDPNSPAFTVPTGVPGTPATPGTPTEFSGPPAASPSTPHHALVPPVLPSAPGAPAGRGTSRSDTPQSDTPQPGASQSDTPSPGTPRPDVPSDPAFPLGAGATAVVPEPTSAALLAGGLTAAAWAWRRRRR